MHPLSALSILYLAVVSWASPIHAGVDDAQRNGGRSKLYARADVVSSTYNINAHLEFWGYLDGGGTYVKVEVHSGLLAESSVIQGPFLYHVHTNPVGKSRNCTAAFGHLDPLNATESLVCDPAFPQYCQEGDLSNKHGKLNGTSSGAIEAFAYTDDYLRFFPADFSILGRSIVIHSANKTRLACGDIISTLDGTADQWLNPTYKKSKYVTKYPSGPLAQPVPVVTPFVGTVMPSDTTLHNLPWPLPNPALPLQSALNVGIMQMEQNVYVNGTQTTAVLPMETKSTSKPPFHGYWDNSSGW